MDIVELESHADSLTELLNDDKDVTDLDRFQHQSNTLHLLLEKDFDQVHNSVRDCIEMVDSCKEKLTAAGLGDAADEELRLLQKELEEELELHRILTMELSEIADLEQHGMAGQERIEAMKKVEQDDLRAEMKLSTYASVTNVIPCLDDENKVSGHILGRDKNVIEKFQFDLSEVSAFETCNNIWKMIKFVESKYEEMPSGHANLLTDHLNQMKDTGEIFLSIKNKDPDEPSSLLKNGRGKATPQKVLPEQNCVEA